MLNSHFEWRLGYGSPKSKRKPYSGSSNRNKLAYDQIKDYRENMIVIPNSKMGEAVLTNYMEPKPHFRIDLQFVLDYAIAPNRALRLLSGAVKSLIDNTRILEKPEPEVRLDEALGHGQKYEVRFLILPSGISPKESIS